METVRFGTAVDNQHLHYFGGGAQVNLNSVNLTLAMSFANQILPALILLGFMLAGWAMCKVVDHFAAKHVATQENLNSALQNSRSRAKPENLNWKRNNQ